MYFLILDICNGVQDSTLLKMEIIQQAQLHLFVHITLCKEQPKQTETITDNKTHFILEPEQGDAFYWDSRFPLILRFPLSPKKSLGFGS